MSGIGSIKTCVACRLYYRVDPEHAEVCQSCALGEDRRGSRSERPSYEPDDLSKAINDTFRINIK